MTDNEFLAFLKQHPELWPTVLRTLREYQSAEFSGLDV